MKNKSNTSVRIISLFLATMILLESAPQYYATEKKVNPVSSRSQIIRTSAKYIGYTAIVAFMAILLRNYIHKRFTENSISQDNNIDITKIKYSDNSILNVLLKDYKLVGDITQPPSWEKVCEGTTCTNTTAVPIILKNSDPAECINPLLFLADRPDDKFFELAGKNGWIHEVFDGESWALETFNKTYNDTCSLFHMAFLQFIKPQVDSDNKPLRPTLDISAIRTSIGKFKVIPQSTNDDM